LLGGDNSVQDNHYTIYFLVFMVLAGNNKKKEKADGGSLLNLNKEGSLFLYNRKGQSQAKARPKPGQSQAKARPKPGQSQAKARRLF
jgi:hypothetical protein